MHNSQDVDAQLDLARAPRGGRRRGAGRPFGVKNKSTLLSEEHSRSLEVLAALQDEGLVCDITVRIYHEEDSRLEGSVFTKRVDKEQLSGVIDSFKKYKREEFERLVATLVKQRRERHELVDQCARADRLNKEKDDKAELFLQVSSAFTTRIHCPALAHSLPCLSAFTALPVVPVTGNITHAPKNNLNLKPCVFCCYFFSGGWQEASEGGGHLVWR